MSADAVFVTVLVGLAGLIAGSFLNVVIARVPAGRSLLTPSACPACHTPIRARDNVPVLSWLVLRGRCRACGARISPRYPLVELGTAAAFTLVALARVPALVASSGAELAAGVLELLAYLAFAAFAIALAAIDLDVRRLPNVLVLSSLGTGAVLLGAAAIVGGDLEAGARAAAGAGLAFALYFVIELASRGGLGMGDVKLAATVGLHTAYLGWGQLAVGVFAGFALGGVVGLALLAARRASRRTAIPFGPWILAGAWLGIVVGHQVAAWYGGVLA